MTASAPEDVEDLVRSADALMYRVKNGGKDGLLLEEIRPVAPALD